MTTAVQQQPLSCRCFHYKDARSLTRINSTVKGYYQCNRLSQHINNEAKTETMGCASSNQLTRQGSQLAPAAASVLAPATASASPPASAPSTSPLKQHTLAAIVVPAQPPLGIGKQSDGLVHTQHTTSPLLGRTCAQTRRPPCPPLSIRPATVSAGPAGSNAANGLSRRSIPQPSAAHRSSQPRYQRHPREN